MNRVSSKKSKKELKKEKRKKKKGKDKQLQNNDVFDDGDYFYINNSRHSKECYSDEKNKKKKHPIRNFFIFLFIIIIIFSILFYMKVKENGGGVQGILCTLLGQSLQDINSLEPINILALGISEDLDSKLTDTIIVCSYNPKKQTAYMVSIPRDTFIGKNKASAKGTDKINALYSKKGVSELKKKATEITGINIDYYAVVNNQAVIDIVDIIGGVYFDVPIDMDYDDPTQDLHIHLKKGYQLLDGERAEQLLRFRHNNDNTSYPTEYGNNDFGRMKTQREFMKSTVNQTMSLKNVFKANIIVNSVFNNLDTDLKKKDILPYVPTLANFDTNNITSIQIPGESAKLNDLWFFIYDKKKTKSNIEGLIK